MISDFIFFVVDVTMSHDKSKLLLIGTVPLTHSTSSHSLLRWDVEAITTKAKEFGNKNTHF
jgi:hypothetical protein